MINFHNVHFLHFVLELIPNFMTKIHRLTVLLQLTVTTEIIAKKIRDPLGKESKVAYCLSTFFPDKTFAPSMKTDQKRFLLVLQISSNV